MRTRLIVLAALASPVAAEAAMEIPLSAVGLPFAPESPTPVSPEHPLYGRILLGEIEQLPGMIRFSIARPTTINEGLRTTLAKMNMLARNEAEAKVRLVVQWIAIEPSSAFVAGKEASATLAYRLVRIDNGQTIFEKTIRTTVETRGSHHDGTMSGRRSAVAVNFASAAACFDKAAFGGAPEDCALSPLFKVGVSRR